VTTFLLDSDIAIELLRGRNLRVTEQLAARSRDAIFLSSVTIAELTFGALRSHKSQENLVICRRFCSALQLADLDRDAAEQSGTIRAELEGRGERVGAYDLLIGGIALAGGHILVTHNVRHFRRVDGLHLEDWAEIK
jgi:tRNA(fMet)-specific endonuclease VapC